CIATYNRPEFLREAIESLLAQTIKDFELIVVDDGSDNPGVDNLRREMAPVFAERRWRWEKQTNQGPSRARNHAASLARGTHFLFMDDDNMALPDELDIFSRSAMTGADILSSIFGLYSMEDTAPMTIARFPARNSSRQESIAVHWIFYGPCLGVN